MSANKTIGGINVTISASTEKFAKGIGQARRTMSDFSKQVSATQMGLKSFGAAIGGALTVGGISRFVKDGMNQISQLSELSDKLGVSTEKLAGMQLAAQESGVSTGLLERSMAKMVQQTAAAAKGVGGISDVYKQLGIDAEALNRLAPDEQLMEMADAISGMADQNEKLNATMAIFGSRGADMIRLLKLGKSGMLEYNETARQMGLTISDSLAAEIEKCNDSLERMHRVFDGLKITAAQIVFPGIKALDELLQGALLNQEDTKSSLQTALAIINPALFMPKEWLTNPAKSFKEVAKTRKTPAFANHGSGAALFTEKTPQQREEENTLKLIESVRAMAGGASSHLGGIRGKRIGGLRLGDLFSDATGGWKWKAAGMLGAGGGLMDGWERMKDRSRGASAMRPALSFAESGSVESYRQQAAIRRQGEEIGRKQLKTQEAMLGELRKQNANAIVLHDANFSR